MLHKLPYRVDEVWHSQTFVATGVREDLDHLKRRRILQFAVSSIWDDEHLADIGRKVLLGWTPHRGADVLPRVFDALHLYELYDARPEEFSSTSKLKAIECVFGEIECERWRYYPLSTTAQKLKRVQSQFLKLVASTHGSRPFTHGKMMTDGHFESLLRAASLLDLWKYVNHMFTRKSGVVALRDTIIATLKTLPAHRLKIFVRLLHCVVHPPAVPYYMALQAPVASLRTETNQARYSRELATVVINATVSADLHSMPYETSKQRKEILSSPAVTQTQQGKLSTLLSHQYCTNDPDCNRPLSYPAPMSPYERMSELTPALSRQHGGRTYPFNLYRPSDESRQRQRSAPSRPDRACGSTCTPRKEPTSARTDSPYVPSPSGDSHGLRGILRTSRSNSNKRYDSLAYAEKVPYSAREMRDSIPDRVCTERPHSARRMRNSIPDRECAETPHSARRMRNSGEVLYSPYTDKEILYDPAFRWTKHFTEEHVDDPWITVPDLKNAQDRLCSAALGLDRDDYNRSHHVEEYKRLCELQCLADESDRAERAQVGHTRATRPHVNVTDMWPGQRLTTDQWLEQRYIQSDRAAYKDDTGDASVCAETPDDAVARFRRVLAASEEPRL